MLGQDMVQKNERQGLITITQEETEMTQTIEQLQAKVAELEAEVLRLRGALKHIKYETDIHGNNLNRGIKDEAVKVFSTQFTPTALNELIEKVEKMTIERCATAVGLEDSYQDDGFKAKCKAVEQIHDLPTGQIKLEELL